jgi:hypothetical protein
MTVRASGDSEPRTAALRRDRERLVFAAATAVLVAQALIDAFVSLVPGALRSEHLAAGLVPAAVGLLAIWLWPRLQYGLRASIALLFGALALVGGALAVNEIAAGRVLLRDVSGLLLFPAGVALVALGVRLLWRSRKGGRLRHLRRAGLAVLGLLALYWLVLPIGMAMLATHRPPEQVRAVDLGRPVETVRLTGGDGVALAARYVPSENGAAVLALPGTWSEDEARVLVEHGYGVLLLDPQGYGDSEGDPNAFGYGWPRDVDAAVAHLAARADVRDGRVGALGISVGGEQLLEAAAGNEALRAVASEGAGLRSFRETFTRLGPSVVEKALQLPFDLVQTAATAVLSGDAPPPSLEEQVPRIAPRPVLFIYGERGNADEIALTPAYHAAAGEPKTLWRVPGAAHTAGLTTQPAEYERRLVEFFDAALMR